jgi:hypothetical protein
MKKPSGSVVLVHRAHEMLSGMPEAGAPASRDQTVSSLRRRSRLAPSSDHEQVRIA